jgi:hypothetical protein
MREVPDNAYTFRTDITDNYIDRVKAEADPEANFLIVIGENKLTGEKELNVFVRNYVTALSHIVPGIKLGPETLETWMDQALKDSKNRIKNEGLVSPKGIEKDFVGMTFTGDAEGVEKAREAVEQDIRHITNILKGRVTQVVVEAF